MISLPCAANNVICVFLEEFINSPGFPFKVGLMIATAIIMGFVLYDDYNKIWKWFVTGFIYILFQEWLRATYFASAGIDYTGRSAILGVFSAGLFGLGVAVGALIAKKVYEKKYIESDEALEIVEQAIEMYRKNKDKENIQDGTHT